MTMTSPVRSTTALRPRLAKVPEVIAVFWLLKLITTAVGEVVSDWMINRSWLLAGVIGGGGLIAAAVWQFRSDRYSAPRYWSLALMIAVFGTTAADYVVKEGGNHTIGTILYSSMLALILAAWWLTERTLSFHQVNTRRREAFYWATVFATFALGTAVGDLTADEWGLGFFDSIWLFAALMLVPLILWRLGLNVVATFWTAYILTRPLGASISDWMAKPWLGGANLGVAHVSLGGLLLFVVIVAWLHRTKRDVQEPGHVAASLP